MRIEDAFSQHEVIGFLSVGDDHEQGISLKKGNVFDEQRFSFNNFFLPDMAKASELKNYDKAKLAVIERVNLNTPLDEKNTEHYDLDMTGSTPYPYSKTRAGALQSKVMPWHYEKRQTMWSLTGGLAAFIALASKVVR